MKTIKIIIIAAVLGSCTAVKQPVQQKPVPPTEQKKNNTVVTEVAIIVLTSVIRAIIR